MHEDHMLSKVGDVITHPLEHLGNGLKGNTVGRIEPFVHPLKDVLEAFTLMSYHRPHRHDRAAAWLPEYLAR